MENHEETQYLKLLTKVLDKGTWEDGRNGKVKSIFGEMFRFSLTNNTIPILTTKRTAWKTCLKELLWFIKGHTDNKLLKDQNVHIWDENTTREFLDSRGLHEYSRDIAGPIYGYQWRHYNANYDCVNATNKEDGIDQLQQIIDALKDPTQRNSRRLVMTAWNPCQLEEMCLPPCHVLCQFNVHNGNKLSCSLYQRSADLCLGVPFNIASYSFLTHLIAKHCGLEAYEFIHFIGNVHIYEDHIEPIQQQINRVPNEFPKVLIKNVKENIEDYNVDDFEIHDYNSHESIKMKMIA
jgi:thymidylate synthase